MVEINRKVQTQATPDKKIQELEQHFLRLLDALVDLEERISSLEKSRENIHHSNDI